MSCAITSGYTLDCKDAIGGIKKVYFGNAEPSAMTLATNASGVITSVSGISFYAYELLPQGKNNFTETINSNAEVGTLFYTQLLSLEFTKLTQATRNKLATIAKRRNVVIVETHDGTFFMLGETYGLECSGGTAMSGAAMGEFQGYQLALTGMEKNPMDQVLAVTAFTIVS
jgi:hypothetical protein